MFINWKDSLRMGYNMTKATLILLYFILTEYLSLVSCRGGRGGSVGGMISSIFGGKSSGKAKKSGGVGGASGKIWYTPGGGPSIQLIFLIIVIVIFGVAALLVIIRFLTNHFCRTLDGDSLYGKSDEELNFKEKEITSVSKLKQQGNVSENSETLLLYHLTEDCVKNKAIYSQLNERLTSSDNTINSKHVYFPIRRQPSAPEESLLLEDNYVQNEGACNHLNERLTSSDNTLNNRAVYFPVRKRLPSAPDESLLFGDTQDRQFVSETNIQSSGSQLSCLNSLHEHKSLCPHSLHVHHSGPIYVNMPLRRPPYQRQVSMPEAFYNPTIIEGRSAEIRPLPCVPEIETGVIQPNECPPSYMDAVKRTRSYSI